MSLSASACSIYPLPEDATGVDSDQIETIVRCETRDAIRGEILDNIRATSDAVVYEGMTGAQTAVWLEEDPSRFRKLDWSHFAKRLSGPFLYYKDTSVSYDFTIDTTESNTAGVTVSLLEKVIPGSNAVGLVARNDRMREVKRHFRDYDSFDSLARKLPEAACAGVPKSSNPLYPATGLIRIRSLVRSFLRQNQLGNLAGDAADYNTAQMTDTITFTTKSTGNVDPSFARNPALGAIVPTSVAVNLDNSRQDMHTIIVLIRLPVSKSGLPRFDEIGRIALPPKEAQRAVSSAALDRQRDFNAQDALTQIGTGVSRAIP